MSKDSCKSTYSQCKHGHHLVAFYLYDFNLLRFHGRLSFPMLRWLHFIITYKTVLFGYLQTRFGLVVLNSNDFSSPTAVIKHWCTSFVVFYVFHFTLCCTVLKLN